MKELFPTTGVGGLCGLFGKSRQAFYDKENRELIRLNDEQFILEIVILIRREMPFLGLRKLYHILEPELAEKGVKMGRDKLYDLLLRNGLMLKPSRRFHLTTYSNHQLRYYPNLIRKLTPETSDQIWVSDITYLRVNITFVYLSLITDAYSKQIVGYNLHANLSTEGCIIALRMALETLDSDRELIHHSDRGIQYCSKMYVDMLGEYKIQISMSEKASPYQNAIAERVNGILKHEFGLDNVFSSHLEAVQTVDTVIKIYNEKRPHASCNYLTPVEAHGQIGEMKKRWKKNEKRYDKKPVYKSISEQ